jgi:nuclear pore complex protein Nup205
MAFLLSVSATRKGAESLLDAGLFEILSMCSFLSVRPYAENSCESKPKRALNF